MSSMYSQERVKDILSRVPLNPLSPGENELTLHFCISVFPHFFSLHSDILQQRVTVCMPGFSSLKLVKCKVLIIPCLMRMLSLIVMLFNVIKNLKIFW